ncbi:MAG TPA: hypothetical protein VJU77_13065 [Chthoniobacterales bacterium]|nr:hypothetical protein [Chthoniobacterales bacterium]
MKSITIIAAFAVIAAVLGSDAVEFVAGFNSFPVPIGFLRAACFPFAWSAFATGAAVIVALFWRRIECAVILALTIVTCWLVSSLLAGRPMFLLGFATRLHVSSSPAEIQSVAQTCLSLMPDGGSIYGPRKGLRPPPEKAEQSRRAWDAIRAHSFVHMDGDTCVIFVRPPEVEFSWGGALPGHWGVHVGRSELRPPFYHQTLSFSDGITVFRGE